MFLRAIWYFEAQNWNNAVGSDAAELCAGPGSYDISKSVWHINVSIKYMTLRHFANTQQGANPELNGGGGCGVFNAIIGWQSSTTYGSVISYSLCWIAVIAGFFVMRYREVKGCCPLMKTKGAFESGEEQSNTNSRASSDVSGGSMFGDKKSGDALERPFPRHEIPA